MSIRLDKYLANLDIIPRRQAGKFLKQGLISINGETAYKGDQKINIWDIINYAETDIEVKEQVSIIFYKPKGYVCSDIDENYPSYRHLLKDRPYANLVHVAGRLDWDTEGLVVASSDGQFIHDIIAPKKKLEKEYFVQCAFSVSDEDLKKLEVGVTLDDGYTTLPAKAWRMSEKEIKLVIHEGKFHQVKKMLESLANKVTYLRRDRVWNWTLEWLTSWERREITPQS